MKTATLKYGNEIFENYTISENGIITDIKRNKAFSFFIKKSGYPVAHFKIDNKLRHFFIHKAIFCSFNPKIQIPEGYHIHHINSDKTDFSLRNLQLIDGIIHASFRKSKNKKYKYFAKIKGMKHFSEIANFSKFCKSVGILDTRNVLIEMTRDSKCTYYGIEFYREEIIGEN